MNSNSVQSRSKVAKPPENREKYGNYFQIIQATKFTESNQIRKCIRTYPIARGNVLNMLLPERTSHRIKNRRAHAVRLHI